MIELELKVAQNFGDDFPENLMILILKKKSFLITCISTACSFELGVHLKRSTFPENGKIIECNVQFRLTITWAKIRMIRFEDLRLDMALKNLAIVMRRPRIEVTAMIPMSRKEICCDQNLEILVKLLDWNYFFT